MKTAIGMLMAVIGGIMVYDGFAGRSLWGDALAILRGQTTSKATSGIPTATSNPQAAANPQLIGGGDTGNSNVIPPGQNVIPANIGFGTVPNPIGKIVSGLNGNGQ